MTDPPPSDEPHPAAREVDELLKQCEMRRVRRSGPGGQHRNKVETGVVLRHVPTDVVAEASERRSVEANRGVAIRRLRIRLALEIRRAPLACPSDLWRTRCHNGRLSVSARHKDFPALLAEILDHLHASDADPREAASLLECSTSQLVRFLKVEPAAFALVNSWRREHDRHPLK